MVSGINMSKFGYNKEILDILSKARPQKNAASVDNEEPIKKKEVKEVVQEKPKTNQVATIGLNGIKISENGQISKTRFFDTLKLNDDEYKDVQFTPEEAQKISASIRFMSTGLTSAIPLTCKGNDCAFASSCPYVKQGHPPTGRPCLVEKQLLEYWISQYVEEFQVDFNSYTELRMVSELAEFDIYEMRITKYIAETDPTLMAEVTTGFTDLGSPITNIDISKAFELKERIKRNRMKILDALVATRKDKAKIISNVISGSNVADKLSEIKQKLEMYSSEVSKVSIVDAEFREKNG